MFKVKGGEGQERGGGGGGVDARGGGGVVELRVTWPGVLPPPPPPPRSHSPSLIPGLQVLNRHVNDDLAPNTMFAFPSLCENKMYA